MKRCMMQWALRSLVGAALIIGAASLAQGQTSQGTSKGDSQSQASAPRGKKLYLKDGSFQLVKSYEIEGDRVRYYSIEQGDWQEIPASLVDWDATKKEEAEQARRDATLLATVHKQEEAHNATLALDVDASLEVLPHVFLPPGEGMFVLEGTKIFPLTQSETVEKRDKKKLLEQVLVPIPVVPSRKSISLEGAHAKFRVTTPQPEFYMRTTDPGEPRVELIRTKVAKDTRLVENLDTLFFVEQKQVRQDLPIQQWQVAPGVYRFTLGQPLPPGEYALAETFMGQGAAGEDRQINLYVWDFGVDRVSSGEKAR